MLLDDMCIADNDEAKITTVTHLHEYIFSITPELASSWFHCCNYIWLARIVIDVFNVWEVVWITQAASQVSGKSTPSSSNMKSLWEIITPSVPPAPSPQCTWSGINKPMLSQQLIQQQGFVVMLTGNSPYWVLPWDLHWIWWVLGLGCSFVPPPFHSFPCTWVEM